MDSATSGVMLTAIDRSIDSELFRLYQAVETVESWATVHAIDPIAANPMTAVYLNAVSLERNVFVRGVSAVFKAIINSVSFLIRKIGEFFVWLAKAATFSKDKALDVYAKASKAEGKPEKPTLTVKSPSGDKEKNPRQVRTGNIIKEGKVYHRMNLVAISEKAADEATSAVEELEKQLDKDPNTASVTIPEPSPESIAKLEGLSTDVKVMAAADGSKVKEMQAGRVTIRVTEKKSGEKEISVASSSVPTVSLESEEAHEVQVLAQEMKDIAEDNLRVAKLSPDKTVNKFKIALERLNGKLDKLLSSRKIDQKKADALAVALSKISRNVIMTDAVDRTLRKAERDTVEQAIRAVSALTKNLK